MPFFVIIIIIKFENNFLVEESERKYFILYMNVLKHSLSVGH